MTGNGRFRHGGCNREIKSESVNLISAINSPLQYYDDRRFTRDTSTPCGDSTSTLPHVYHLGASVGELTYRVKWRLLIPISHAYAHSHVHVLGLIILVYLYQSWCSLVILSGNSARPRRVHTHKRHTTPKHSLQPLFDIFRNHGVSSSRW
jgi:hypothetical protein